MSTDKTASKLATPGRIQALSGLFRTPTRLRTPTMVSRRNKRTRGRMSPSSSTPSTPSTPSLPAVVLQTYSLSTDSIVLTALPSVPFCCHEDLLTMSRAQLEDVVRALNVRLPRRMRVGPEDDFWENNCLDCHEERNSENDDGLSRMSDAEMRKRIEELVGIRTVVGKNRVSRLGLGMDPRGGVPPAPKPVRTRDAGWRPYEKNPWEMEVDSTEDQVDDSSIMIEDALMGSSPLASRTKPDGHSHARNGALSHLAILEEENEGHESDEDKDGDETRSSKRQRLSLGSDAQHSEEGSQIVQESRESRLIENMYLSGSPLLDGEGDASSDNFIESDKVVITATVSPEDSGKASKEYIQAPLQRRRSARIQNIAVKRASSVNTAKKTSSGTTDPEPFALRSKAFSSRRSSVNDAAVNAEKDSDTPREFTIRLPFASTPPHQKLNPLTWSAPRILRSHSQRLLNSSRSTKIKASLGRSQSERYPRATDMAFVTIDRPRYRFTRRKSEAAKGNHESHPLTSAPPATTLQPPLGIEITMEHSNGRREYEKENEDSKVASRTSVMGGGLHTLPPALFNFLAPRSRAPSTSTVASARGNCGDSPARATANEATAPTPSADSLASDGATERVWAALGKMVVGSLKDGSE